MIPVLGIYPKNPETPIQKILCTPMFIAELFTIAKIWKQPKCPSVEYYVAGKKKNEFLPIMTKWMELETIVLSEISQSMKDKYHMSHL